MVPQEGQHQAYGCGGSVRGWWGGVAAVVSAAAAAAADAGEEVEENRPNKKPKQKKAPQRGLGVAQLEKIRLEEQQSGGVVTSASSLPGPFSPVIPLPPLPLPSTPFLGASDLNPATRPSIPMPPAPFCDLLVPVAPPAEDASMVAPPARLAGHGFLPPLPWNPLEIIPHDVETSNKMFSFPVPLQEDYSNTNTWQPSGPVERQQHRQQQPKHPLLPNSSVNPLLPPPLSGFKLRMDPPSSQTIMSKPGSPLWLGDEKNVVSMAGMKRPWRFHLDAMADYTSFPCKLPLPPLPIFPPVDEYPPMNGRDHLLDFKPATTNLRDGPPGSGTFQAEGRSSYGHPPERRCKQRSNAPVHGEFLTLGSSLSPPAPPPAAPPKLKQTPGSTLLPQYREPSTVSAPVPYHGNPDEISSGFAGSSQSPADKLPFYSFLPMRSSSQETSLEEHKHETVGSLDLNLKL